MAEQIGTIVKARDELKKDESGMVFKMGVDKYTYSLFTPKLQELAKEYLGKQVKVTFKMSDDGKYRNVESIEPSYESTTALEPPTPKKQWGRSPEEIASIENQVRAKLVMEGWIAGKLLDDSIEVLGMRGWIRKGLPFDATVVVQPLSKATETTVDTPRRSIYDEIEAIGAEPISEEQAAKLRLGLFKVECKRYGWDVSTKKGADAVAAWLTDNPPYLKWKELVAEAQELAIKRMSQMCEEKEE